MRVSNRTIIAAACGVLSTVGVAQAHYLWLEPDEAGARLFYGEAEGGLKEKSPGKLDTIKAPRAFVLNQLSGQHKALTVSLTAGHFFVNGGGKSPALLATEGSLEVRDLTKHGLGMAKTNYYARYGQPKGPNDQFSFALDVQGRDPNKLTVLYRGQPLKGAKLEVIAPNTWVQEYRTDTQGRVAINTPWRGSYVIHVLHVDATPGEFDGKKYESLRNHFTYTFLKADGADPGPAVPPSHGSD
ncbi:DUF4198 domain-containing protein [Denitratisoma oestradiolicum]|uniref:Uncharacterized protein n=1 Tax=Denitratisoma oestradiolicum TaxID=311182 RepID=A0A6S6XZ36_9PROT|nr:DUF4198 domain-containing protein [Denitratisoma oestradiolicum]TWO80404.1 hypothetical protein CBW56_09885 [Denitratisoma oestradiolicum]CAB1370213.1 conserved exported protein of unknown function [Denitratisoma oestradiolicum]